MSSDKNVWIQEHFGTDCHILSTITGRGKCKFVKCKKSNKQFINFTKITNIAGPTKAQMIPFSIDNQQLKIQKSFNTLESTYERTMKISLGTVISKTTPMSYVWKTPRQCNDMKFLPCCLCLPA